jgi:WD40 repeat protein
VVGREESYVYRTDTWEPVGKPLEGLYHDWKDAVSDAAFSPDNRLLVTAMSLRGDGSPPYFNPSTTITFWDVASAEPVGEPISVKDPGPGIAFDTTGGSVRIGESVYDVSTRSVRTLAPEQIPHGHRAVSQLLGFNHSLAPPLWDDDRGGPATVAMPRDDFNQALLSADGQSLLLVGADGMAQLHDAASGTPLGPEFQAEGTACERASDGRYTLFWTGNTMRIWDVGVGRPCGDELQVRGNPQAAFAPGGTVLATHCDFSAQLLDCATGLMLGPPMELSSNQISTPIFTPDARRLYIPSSGLEVWRVPLPAADDPERLRLSIEVRTGIHVGEYSTIRKLSQADWLERKRRLEELGGPCDVADDRREPIADGEAPG